MHSLAKGLIRQLDERLGSRRATERLLGVSNGRVQRRLDGESARREHVHAACNLWKEIEHLSVDELVEYVRRESGQAA